jgi:hypothetical protein
VEVPPQQCLSGCRALTVAQVGRVGETIHTLLASSVWCSVEGLVEAREECLVLCPFRMDLSIKIHPSIRHSTHDEGLESPVTTHDSRTAVSVSET